MAKLNEMVEKVRSKNAGPFWLTVDVFCGSEAAYAKVQSALPTEQVAEVFGRPSQQVKRFDIAQLNVIKFSLPRPFVQGALDDPDMHGASWAALVGEIDIG